MRIVLISDSHTITNLRYIIEYLKKKSLAWKPDFIIVNGDVLGENESREGYGYNYNKTIHHASLDKAKLLSSLFPQSYQRLDELAHLLQTGAINDALEIEMSHLIKDYVKQRYDFVFESLKELSLIAKTYFNLGVYESPLHFNVLRELSFLLDISEPVIRRIALHSPYREIFKEFQLKFKEYKRMTFIGGFTALEGDLLIAGIAGFNQSTIPGDSASDFQEKMTEELISTISRQVSYANKLILLNQCQGKLRKDPFSFRPASKPVRDFIDLLKGRMHHKIYIQSYHHFMTTHFYNASDFNFILNNAAVNNCLFNMIELGNKASCYDIDPKLDKVRKLKLYAYDPLAKPKEAERLALNYDDPEAVIDERSLKGCYYM